LAHAAEESVSALLGLAATLALGAGAGLGLGAPAAGAALKDVAPPRTAAATSPTVTRRRENGDS